MKAMTAGFLRSAFGGESQAHMRYLIYAGQAEAEGFANVARLFTAIAHAERVHATNHFTALRGERGAFDVTSGAGFGLTTTAENLDIAIGGERFEIEHRLANIATERHAFSRRAQKMSR